MSIPKGHFIHITFESDEDSSSTDIEDDQTLIHIPTINHEVKPPRRPYLGHPSFQRRACLKKTNTQELRPASIANEKNQQQNQNNSLPSNTSQKDSQSDNNRMSIQKNIPINIHFEIQNPEFIASRTFVFEKAKSAVFNRSQCFKFLERGKVLFEQTMKILNQCKILLPGNILMNVKNQRSSFVFKENGNEKNFLARISFPPLDNDEIKRNVVIKFGDNLGLTLPYKIVSLPTIDESVFGGHFLIESKRNVALAIINTSRPILRSRQIAKNKIEIDTVLNLPPFILFAITIALYVGENRVHKTEYEFNPSKQMPILRSAMFIP